MSEELKFVLGTCCYFECHSNTISICPKHVNGNPIPSLVHELCHVDLEIVFKKLEIPVHREFKSYKSYHYRSVEHIMSPHKGMGFGACGD